ncbi:MAG: hypothetical protein ACOCZ2_01570 [Thermodesulfobacteriota bacterium]
MLLLPGSEPLIRMNAESLDQKKSSGQGEESGKAASAWTVAKQKAGTNQVDVFDTAHDFFDLSDPGRLSNWSKLDSEEREGFVQMVAKLAQRGLVGYEILDVRGEPYENFLSPRLADREASHAHVYDRNGYFKNLP